MSRELQIDSAVLSAVRRFLHASAAGSEASEAMASLVAETSRLPLTHLEAWESALRTELWKVEEWRSTSWRIWKKPARFVSWLDLCSGDGFRRERTLRTLSAGAPNAFLLLLAVRRLNDWVPEVRAAAREQVPAIASSSDPDHVVDALWHALPHSISWSRLEDRDRQVLSDLITRERVMPILKSRIISATAGPATAVLTQAGRSPALDEWLGEIAASAVQPSVRARAYRWLLEGRIVWVAGRTWKWTDVRWCRGQFVPILGERPRPVEPSFVVLLWSASADRSAAVRRLAGDMLIQRLESVGDEAVKLAELLASDPVPSVAERGRFVLAQLRRSL